MPPLERREGFGFAWWSICRSSNCGGTVRSISGACARRRGRLRRRAQEADQGVEGLFSGTGAPRIGAVHREQRVEQEVRVDPRLYRPQSIRDQPAEVVKRKAMR